MLLNGMLTSNINTIQIKEKMMACITNNGLRHKVCNMVWKVSTIEVEGYLYPDTALGSGTHIQLYENGKCILRTIEFKDFDSPTPVKNIDLSKGKTDKAVTDYVLNLSDSTLTARASFLWDWTSKVGFEARYWYEPYRLDDFSLDIMQPYMQGVFQETRSSAADVGAMNVSRFLFLDSRYTDYTAHVLSAFVHVRF